MQVEGKVFLITGASSGIGAALARVALDAGARVVLAARRRDRLESVLADAGAGNRGLAIATDVTDRGQVEHLVDATVERFGDIHVLVNNAGWGLVAPMTEISLDELEYGIRVNLIGPLWLTRLVLPHLKRAAPSCVVNVSSMAALCPLPLQSMYVASKAGIAGLGTSLRRELRGTGVQVLNVYPGMVDTEIIEGIDLGALKVKPTMYPPDFAGKAILDAIRKGRREVIVGGLGERALAFLNRNLPRVVDRVAANMRDDMYASSTIPNQHARDTMSQPDKNPPSTGNT